MPIMPAKFSAPCNACGKTIRVGERQLWERGKGVWHEACAPKAKVWEPLPQPAERGTTVTRIHGAAKRPDGTDREKGDVVFLPTLAQEAWKLPPYVVVQNMGPIPGQPTIWVDVVPASQAQAQAGATTGAPGAEAVAGALALAQGASQGGGSNPTYLDWDDAEKVWFWTGPREVNNLLKDGQNNWILQPSFLEEYVRDRWGNVVYDERTGKPKRVWNRWQTKYPEAAVRLKEYATPSALRALEAHTRAVESSHAQDAEISCPAPPGWTYRGYQRAAIKYALSRNDGTLIADQPGVGKTASALGVINCEDAKRVLVICPNTAVGNWEVEAKRWLVALDWTYWAPLAGTLKGKGRKGKPSTAGAAPTSYERLFVITGYGKWSNASALRKLLRSMDWDVVVVDESHKVKNLTTNRGKAIIGIPADKEHKGEPPRGGVVDKAKRLLFLTGTPIPNNPVEIWPVLVKIAPEQFPSEASFGFRYGGYQWEYIPRVGRKMRRPSSTELSDPVTRDQLIPPARREELQERMRACCMIRRTLQDVLPEMPPKIRQVVDFTLDSYEPVASELAAKARAALEAAQSGQTTAKFEEEIANLWGELPSFEELSRERHELAGEKAPLVTGHVRGLLDAGVEKVIVFCLHHDMLNGVQEGLSRAPSEGEAEEGGAMVLRPSQVLRIDGSVPAHKRSGEGSIAEQFQNDPQVRVILLQIDAASEAINLFAASHVVFAELPWTPEKLIQAEGRAWRSGQAKTVLSQLLVVDGTLESAMAQLLLAKAIVAEAVLDKPTASVKGPTVDQLLASAEQRESELGAERAVQAALEERHKEEIETLQAAQSAAQSERAAVVHAMEEGKEKDQALKALARQRKLTPDQIELVHDALQSLASNDDGAKKKDETGYNKMDTQRGNALARQPELTNQEAHQGAAMLIKYKGQLSKETWDQLYAIVYGRPAPAEKEKKGRKRTGTAEELGISPAEQAEAAKYDEPHEQQEEAPPFSAAVGGSGTYLNAARGIQYGYSIVQHAGPDKKRINRYTATIYARSRSLDADMAAEAHRWEDLGTGRPIIADDGQKILARRTGGDQDALQTWATRRFSELSGRDEEDAPLYVPPPLGEDEDDYLAPGADPEAAILARQEEEEDANLIPASEEQKASVLTPLQKEREDWRRREDAKRVEWQEQAKAEGKIWVVRGGRSGTGKMHRASLAMDKREQPIARPTCRPNVGLGLGVGSAPAKLMSWDKIRLNPCEQCFDVAAMTAEMERVSRQGGVPVDPRFGPAQEAPAPKAPDFSGQQGGGWYQSESPDADTQASVLIRNIEGRDWSRSELQEVVLNGGGQVLEELAGGPGAASFMIELPNGDRGFLVHGRAVHGAAGNGWRYQKVTTRAVAERTAADIARIRAVVPDAKDVCKSGGRWVARVPDADAFDGVRDLDLGATVDEAQAAGLKRLEEQAEKTAPEPELAPEPEPEAVAAAPTPADLEEAHWEDEHKDTPDPRCPKCARRIEKEAESRRVAEGPTIRLNDWQVTVLEALAGEEGGGDLEEVVRGVFPGGGTRHYSGLDWILAEDEGPEDDPGKGPELRFWWKFTLLPWAGFPKITQEGLSPREIKVPGTPEAREQLWKALRALADFYQKGLDDLEEDNPGYSGMDERMAIAAVEALAEKVISFNYPEQPNLLAGVTERLPAGTGERPRKEPETPTAADPEEAKRQAHRDRTEAYWHEKVMPALDDYFRAYREFRADRLERNMIKPEGLSASAWLQAVMRQKSAWDKGRKTGHTGIQMLNQKGLWEFKDDGGMGERLRKTMLTAIRAVSAAPGYMGGWIERQEEGLPNAGVFGRVVAPASREQETSRGDIIARLNLDEFDAILSRLDLDEFDRELDKALGG